MAPPEADQPAASLFCIATESTRCFSESKSAERSCSWVWARVPVRRSPAFAGWMSMPAAVRQGIREQIEQAGRQLFSEFPIQAIGFGFGGPINATAGIVTTSHQVAGWDNFPLAEWCTQTFGVPTFLGNDCDMAALAEARFGAGRDKRSVFYVTVGTGVGGGLVLDGALFGSQRPAIAEIGHLRPGLEATEPSQTVESLAAGPGIEGVTRTWLSTAPLDDRHAVRLLDRCQKSPQKSTARMIAEEAATRQCDWPMPQWIAPARRSAGASRK